MLAKVNGLFRLTRDAELIYGNSGTSILKLGLACSEKFKDKETQLFIDAVAFGKTGEIISQYSGTKGTQLFLSGKLETQSWKAQDGSNRSKVSMIIESFEFVGGKNQNKNQNQQPTQQQQSPQAQANAEYQQHQAQQPQQPTQQGGLGQMEYEIDESDLEIPF